MNVRIHCSGTNTIEKKAIIMHIHNIDETIDKQKAEPINKIKDITKLESISRMITYMDVGVINMTTTVYLIYLLTYRPHVDVLLQIFPMNTKKHIVKK